MRLVLENYVGQPENELRSVTLGVNVKKSPDFPAMPMTTSRQLKQPQSMFVLEYLLLHNGRKNSSARINLVRINPELYDFYEEYIC